MMFAIAHMPYFRSHIQFWQLLISKHSYKKLLQKAESHLERQHA